MKKISLLMLVSTMCLGLNGCNLADFKLPTLKPNNNTVSTKKQEVKEFVNLKDVCLEAKKNSSRANSMYKGKFASTKGYFYDYVDVTGVVGPSISLVVNNNINIYVNVLSLDENRWHKYNNGDYGETGELKIKHITFYSTYKSAKLYEYKKVYECIIEPYLQLPDGRFI